MPTDELFAPSGSYRISALSESGGEEGDSNSLAQISAPSESEGEGREGGGGGRRTPPPGPGKPAPEAPPGPGLPGPAGSAQQGPGLWPHARGSLGRRGGAPGRDGRAGRPAPFAPLGSAPRDSAGKARDAGRASERLYT